MTMEGLDPAKLSSIDKSKLMEQVQQEIAVANAQELITVSFIIYFCLFFIKNLTLFINLYLQKMTEKCFKKCVSKPGSALDNSEQVNIHFLLE